MRMQTEYHHDATADLRDQHPVRGKRAAQCTRGQPEGHKDEREPENERARV
jgi:hypothetical protein